MNTRTAQPYSWPKTETFEKPVNLSLGEWKTAQPLSAATRFSSRLLWASVSALIVIVGASWVVSAFADISVLAAAISVMGFIFLALAIDSKSWMGFALAASGIALPALAFLSFHVAAEFAILAATIVAGWIAAAIIHYE